jgi:hypothetical protein
MKRQRGPEENSLVLSLNFQLRILSGAALSSQNEVAAITTITPTAID